MDFCRFWLVRTKSLKFGGDDDAAELGGHVGGGTARSSRSTRGRQAVGLGIGGAVAGGVPADGEGPGRQA
jgi:hypothetical protein